MVNGYSDFYTSEMYVSTKVKTSKQEVIEQKEKLRNDFLTYGWKNHM